MSGYVFKIAGAAVLWRCFDHIVLTMSTTEVELIAQETSTSEVEWLR
jgi:hypothetical protein